MGLLVDIVIPVYNEEKILSESIRKLNSYLKKNRFFDYSIIIADNASIDNTAKIGKKLAKEIPNVFYNHLEFKGRGRALKSAWQQSKADIVSYMDVDLSTDISYFPKMIGTMVKEKYDVAFGSRNVEGSIIKRGLKRELLSRSYNFLLQTVAGAKFRDAQCGFKALTRKAAKKLLPLIKDKKFFFDSELLLIAQRKKMKMLEFPVKWIDCTDSRVKIIETIKDYLLSILRMRPTKG